MYAPPEILPLAVPQFYSAWAFVRALLLGTPYSGKGDVYSLGLVGAELCTGRAMLDNMREEPEPGPLDACLEVCPRAVLRPAWL